MHKHARNLAANWISHGVTLVVLFFLSPFIVHTLGMVAYGLWSLLTVLAGGSPTSLESLLIAGWEV